MVKLRAKIDPELVNELNITNIQPVKKRNGGINAVGNVSCCGFIGNQKVKIYTTYRDDLPDLREELETVKFESGIRFPPLIATKGRFVVEQWIGGPNLTQIPKRQVKKFIPAMVDFLFELKDINVNFDSTYDHLNCFASHVTHKQLLEAWHSELSKQPPIPKHLRHGDLHEANLVLNGGTLYSVDNDGVSFDNGWFLSWRKSFLYSTAFPKPPFPELYNNADELEEKYYDGISHKFMRLTHTLRHAYFGRLTDHQIQQRLKKI